MFKNLLYRAAIIILLGTSKLHAMNILHDSELYAYVAGVSTKQFKKLLKTTNKDTSTRVLHRLSSDDKFEPKVDLLLKTGVDVNHKDGNGYSPIHTAVTEGAVKIVELLIKRGANVNQVPNNNGKVLSPLSKAHEFRFKHPRYAAIAKLLEKAGGNKIARGYEQELFKAIKALKNLQAQILIDKGVPVDSKFKFRVDQTDVVATPLWYCIRFSQMKLAEYLLQHGADASIPTSEGDTALHTALAYKYINCIKLLIAHNACVNVLNAKKLTPLHYAYSAEVARLLLNAKAKPTAQSEDGATPLHCAVCNNKYDVAQMLLEQYRVPIDTPDRWGRTPLYLAAVIQKDLALATLLVQHKAVVTADLLELVLNEKYMNRDDTNLPIMYSLLEQNYIPPLEIIPEE